MPLSTTPKLGSMVISAGASWKYTFQQPGITFNRTTEARIEVTDRAGGLLATFFGDVSTNKIEFSLDPAEHEDIPAGMNWEMFIDDGEAVYKVLYGRVIRRQVETPLHPDATDIYDAVSYEDDLQREQVGPYWTRATKVGKLRMYHSSVYGMASDTGAFAQSAALYYAPMRSDSVEITVGLWNAGAGKTTVVLGSNYSMNSFLGVQFDTGSTNRIYIVVGTGPTSYYNVGPALPHAVPQEPLTIDNTYRIAYSAASRTVSVYQGSNLVPLISWTDDAHILPQGPGYRYTGLSWKASLLSTGSRVYYWKAKDATG